MAGSLEGLFDGEAYFMDRALLGDEGARLDLFRSLSRAVLDDSLTARQREWVSAVLLRVGEGRNPLPKAGGRHSARYVERNLWVVDAIDQIVEEKSSESRRYELAAACRDLAKRVNADIQSGNLAMAKLFHVKRRPSNSSYIQGKTLENVYATTSMDIWEAHHPE